MSLRARHAPALLAFAAGCARASPPPPPPPPPIVTVARPIVREVVDMRDFTGRTVAIDQVVVRPRVTGTLQAVHFREGAEVAAGELLYEIDPRPYEAELAEAEGNLAAARAKLARLESDLERAEQLLESHVISQEGYDRTVAERLETAGTIRALEAAVERARLDLEFTRIRAPIAGLTGKNELDPGNLVRADETALTSIVSLHPIHANFDVDERSVLLYRALIRAKKVQSAREAEVPVWLGLSDEEGHPHRGVIDFVDNQLDPTSGTIRVRAVFDNPERALSPGLFVRIRVPFSEPHQALVVPETALSADQRGWYVLVVDERDAVQQRRVELGERIDESVVITKGLVPDERVIVNGLQRARPGAVVQPQELVAEQGAADAAGAQAASR